ncbi:MAG: ParB/RepB/Spo0J family partition protein [Acutalibacteraceae bacterium]|nr:ParB/RepB/Spo0J family partition protein [Acutalibacteraceae bacterium]
MNYYKLIFLNPAEIIPPNKNQSTEDRYKLFLLSESIRENGLLIPVTVTRAESGYRVINGERRVKASIMAGLTKIPCVVTDFEDETLFRATERLSAINFDVNELSSLKDKYGAEFIASMLSMTTGELNKIISPEKQEQPLKEDKPVKIKEKKLPPIKDTKFLINSIKQMIDSVSSAGIPVKYRQSENESCVEIKIKVTKNTVSPQLTLF